VDAHLIEHNIDAIRDHFPGLKRTCAGQRVVFFDNPAGTQVPSSVAQRMLDTLLYHNSNLGGVFETSLDASALVADAHRAAELLVNAPVPGEVFFGQSMTAITFSLSRAMAAEFQPGDEIILSRMDHDANVAPWLMLAKDLGLVVRWLDFSTDTFEFDLADLGALLNPRTRLVAVCYASNISGTINDIASVSRMAHSAGALVYVDAVQFAPHGLIDVQALGCDLLVCSAYKFFGPHYAFCWARRELLERLGAYKVRAAPEELPWKFTSGTVSREALAGIHAAIEHMANLCDLWDDSLVNSGLRAKLGCSFDAMVAYSDHLAAHLLQGLQSLKGVRVLGITDPNALARRVATVSFVVEGLTPDAIARTMAAAGIQLWSGHNYAVEAHRKLGLLDSGGAVRIGLVHYNTLAEIDRALNQLEALVATS